MTEDDLKKMLERTWTTDALVVDGQTYVATDWVYSEDPTRCFCGQFINKHENSKCDFDQFWEGKGP
jgi:hypothetical protein